MFGIGLPELILIMIVALLVVGPKKLPDLAKSIGKALHQVKSMTDDVKQSFEEVTADDFEEPRKTEETETSEAAGDGWSENAGSSGGESDMMETASAVEHDMIEFPAEENVEEDKATEATGPDVKPQEDPLDPPTATESGGHGNLRG